MSNRGPPKFLIRFKVPSINFFLFISHTTAPYISEWKKFPSFCPLSNFIDIQKISVHQNFKNALKSAFNYFFLMSISGTFTKFHRLPPPFNFTKEKNHFFLSSMTFYRYAKKFEDKYQISVYQNFENALKLLQLMFISDTFTKFRISALITFQNKKFACFLVVRQIL